MMVLNNRITNGHTAFVLFIHHWFKVLFIIAMMVSCGNAENRNRIEKKGGVCFRVDDNQDINKMARVVSVFNKYGFKCSFAINANALPRPDYLKYIASLQAMGHEIMDHTPNHTTNYFKDENAERFTGVPGVHHVVGNKVCLAYQFTDSFRRDEVSERGKLVNGRFISTRPGGFQSIGTTGTVPQWLIYLPSYHMLCTIERIQSTNSSDVDTVFIKTIYGEDVYGIHNPQAEYQCVKLDHVRLVDEAVALLIAKTLAVSNDAGLKKPTAWIQPGGNNILVSRDQLKNVAGDRFGYRAGATSITTSIHCFNEVDINRTAAYAMQWGDFYEDFDDLSTIKKKIAYGIARNYVMIGHNHFTGLLGGWDGYIERLDSLLAWCKGNDIPVRTYTEWAEILYSSTSNPYQNIMPRLDIDRDNNGAPDGFYLGPGWTDGQITIDPQLPVGNGRCYSYKGIGSICFISSLGGVEKGANDFSFWCKSYPGNVVTVQFLMSGQQVSEYSFTATDTLWHRYSLSQTKNVASSVFVPATVSNISMRVLSTAYRGGQICVGGFEFKKLDNRSLVIVSTPDTIAVTGMEYTHHIKIQSSQEKNKPIFSLIERPSWLTIDTAGTIYGWAPAMTGRYPVKVEVKDSDGNADTSSFIVTVISRDNFGPLRIVSVPDTLMTPGYTYAYKIEVEQDHHTDELRYELLQAPATLSTSKDGVVSGTLPHVKGKIPVTLKISDQHGNHLVNSFDLKIDRLLHDDFENSERNSAEEWIPTSTNISSVVEYDHDLQSKVLKIDSREGLDDRIDCYGLWRSNNINLLLKPKSLWSLYVWCIDSAGKTFFIQYSPTQGVPVKTANSIDYPIGKDHGIGWRFINREINRDLQEIDWGSPIVFITSIQFRGSVVVDDIYFGDVEIRNTDIERNALPGKHPVYQLFQNYPNPFNPSTIISFSIPTQGRTTLEIIDILGRRIETIADDEFDAGYYSYEWRPISIGSGIYFCKMSTPLFTQVQKLLYIK